VEVAEKGREVDTFNGGLEAYSAKKARPVAPTKQTNLLTLCRTFISTGIKFLRVFIIIAFNVDVAGAKGSPPSRDSFDLELPGGRGVLFGGCCISLALFTESQLFTMGTTGVVDAPSGKDGLAGTPSASLRG
jgi:hypothetical protein